MIRAPIYQAALAALSRDETGSLAEAQARVCAVASTVLRVARVGIWFFDPGQTKLRCEKLYDDLRPDCEHGQVLDRDAYPYYFEALRAGRTLVWDQWHQEPANAEFPPEYLAEFGIQSMLHAPVRRDFRVVGVLRAEHCGEPRAWTLEEQSFAGSLGDLVTLALESDRRRRFTQRLTILRQTDHAILTARSIGEIAQVALDGLRELIPFRRGSVVLFDQEGRVGKIIGAIAPEESKLVVGAEVDATIYSSNGALRRGSSFLVDDIRSAPAGRLRDLLEQDGVKSFLSTPMVELGRVIGTLNCSVDRHGVFTAEHEEILGEVADSLAVAIYQAELRREVQQHAELLEQRVAERATELTDSNRRLLESQERLRSMYDNTPVMMHSVDAEAVVIEVNQFWLTMLGYTREEVIGRSIIQFVPRQFQATSGELLRQLNREGFIKDIEVQMCCKNGDVLDMLASSVLKRDPEGRFLYTQTFLVDVTEQRRTQRENTYLQEQIRTELNFEELVGTSAVMQRVFQAVDMVAPTDSTVLLMGETGTGKELIARALHNRSRRKPSVMVKLNCGALPASLMESELFGHEKGSFTGAIAQKKGRFELAHKGTLFLEEIGELPLDTQSKLLRVLQEQEFERVGGAVTQKVDVRVIAASNRDLEDEVRRGVFRSDLYYRLNVFPIEVPPLRERKEDIPLLAAYFVGKFTQRMGRRIYSIHRSAQEQLMDYDWPGNVRELANLLERGVILCQGDTLMPQHLSVNRARGTSAGTGPEPILTLEDGERRLIQRALEQTGGVLAGANGAAQLLGINRSTLWSRMRKLGIDAPRPKSPGV